MRQSVCSRRMGHKRDIGAGKKLGKARPTPSRLSKRGYLDKNGDTKVRDSLTYEPFLKTKLTGVLAGSFLRANKGEGAQPWRSICDGYKHRIETDPLREKVT